MKWVITVFLIIVFLCTPTVPIENDWEEVIPYKGQRFRIWSSFLVISENNTEVNLQVILCTGAVDDLDSIFEEIRTFHNQMNGTPSRLTIRLSRSKKDLQNSVEIATRVYKKGE